MHFLKMKINKLHISEEHIILQNMESYNISAYSILKKVDPFDVPNVLNFFDIVTKYLELSKLLIK